MPVSFLLPYPSAIQTVGATPLCRYNRRFYILGYCWLSYLAAHTIPALCPFHFQLYLCGKRTFDITPCYLICTIQPQVRCFSWFAASWCCRQRNQHWGTSNDPYLPFAYWKILRNSHSEMRIYLFEHFSHSITTGPFKYLFQSSPYTICFILPSPQGQVVSSVYISSQLILAPPKNFIEYDNMRKTYPSRHFYNFYLSPVSNSTTLSTWAHLGNRSKAWAEFRR